MSKINRQRQIVFVGATMPKSIHGYTHEDALSTIRDWIPGI